MQSTDEVTYATFGCNVNKENPATPDRLTPDVLFTRTAADSIDLTAPDGKKIRFWAFNNSYPGPTMRVRQGQVVHTKLTTSKGPHTIHHHGIEPTTMNDGVGHVSFEVSDQYTYQWKPHVAGTYFYHCHRNTVLHFEMGMVGMLIVDPPEGPGRAFQNGPAYDVEKVWMADDVDPRWHLFENHDTGMCGEDVGLDRFEPKYFMLTGVFAPRTATDPRTVINATVGQTILIRLLNASYSVLRVKLGLDALVVGCDGNPLGRPEDPWCKQVLIPANQTFDLTTAQRYDLLITPKVAGTFNARLEFRHWITGAIQDAGRGVAQSRIIVK
jgi:FtsP/CotA-like multicopper oxidase with cupredoxin domain